MADFIEKEHCLPQDKGYKVETIIRKNGKKEMGVWVQSDEPLRRRHQNVKRTILEEEIDNSEGALTADQLCKRYKAESSAMGHAAVANGKGATSPAAPRGPRLSHSAAPLLESPARNASSAPSPSPSSRAQATTPTQDRAPLGMGLLEEVDAAGTGEGREVASVLEKALGKRNQQRQKVSSPQTPKGDDMTDIRKMIEELTNPADSPSPTGGRGGRGGGGRGGRAAAPIPKTTMVELQLGWEDLVVKAGTVETPEELANMEGQLVKAVKAIEKKIDTGNEIEQLDNSHLDFQAAVNDLYDKLVTYKDLYASYSAFSSSSGHGGEQPKKKPRKKNMAPLEAPADRLKSAIQSACSLLLEIPPIIEKATKVFIVDELLEKEEYEKLVIAMGEFKEDDCVTAPLATLVTEKLSLVMTRLLRKCVEKQTEPVEYNKFVMTASKQPFPQEVKDQLLVLVDLANVETLPTRRVIETVDTLTKKKPAQLPALHKVIHNNDV